MNPVVHFEMPADDKERMKKFYTEAFGWKMEQYGPEMGNYTVVATTEVDEKTQMPKEPGRINGGFFDKTEESYRNARITVAVDNIEEGIKKVEEAGGKVKGHPVEIPHVGKYVEFTDTEGNQLSLLQPSPMG